MKRINKAKRHDWSALNGFQCSRCELLRAFEDSGSRGGRHAVYGRPGQDETTWTRSGKVPPCEGEL